MSQDTVSVHDIELEIEEAREFVELGRALERLEQNRDFQKLILEGFLKTEAVRLVEAKALPNCQSDEIQKQILKSIDGIGVFREFLRKTRFQAVSAEQAIEESEQTIEEMLESGEAA